MTIKKAPKRARRCPDCNREVRIRKVDDRFVWHRTRTNNEGKWCQRSAQVVA